MTNHLSAKSFTSSASTKVALCHKQKVSIRVSTSAWPAHQGHGDVQGACAEGSRAAAKAKAKADKPAKKVKADKPKKAEKPKKKSGGKKKKG